MNGFPDQRANLDFLNDALNGAEQRGPRLRSLCRRSKQNLPDRYASNINLLMKGSLDKPGPQFHKGASFEEVGGYVGMKNMWTV